MNSMELKPVAIDQMAPFDYSIRAAALRLLREKLIDGPPHLYRLQMDETLVSPQLREIVDCLTALAVDGFLEYYGGWDAGAAEMTIARELGIAEDLENPEVRM